MKRILPRTWVSLFVLIVVAAWPAWGVLREQQAPHAEVAARYSIRGTVVDATPDFSEALFAKLERTVGQVPDAIQDLEEEAHELWEKALKDAFGESRSQRRMPGVLVTLRGESLASETTTDAQGRYHFTGLPRGTYVISATAPVRPPSRNGPERITTARKEFKVYGSNQTVDLEFHGESITLKGRITDARGRPIAGAKLRGEPYPLPEVSELTPATRFAVSAADGSYEMRGFVPFHVWDIVKYLAGSDMIPDGHYFHNYSFYSEVFVEADGFVQHKKNVPRVPIVSEDMLDAARRFGKILNQMAAIVNEMEPQREIEPWREKQDLSPPASHGNSITGIDIVLDPWPRAHVSGRVLDTKGDPAQGRVLELRSVKSGSPPLPGDGYAPAWPIGVAVDENGAFDIPSIIPGRYSIVVYRPSPIGGDRNMQQVPVQGQLLEVKPDARVEGFEIRINPPEDYTISGHVRDASGNPVCGLFVGTWGDPHGRCWWTRTDAQGAYYIDGLDGTGLSSFEISFGHNNLAIPEVPLNSKNVDLIVPDTGSIHGAVRNAKTGEVITTCQVTVPVVDLPESRAVYEEPHVQIERKPDGSFILSNVPAGEATVEIRVEGLGAQRFAVTVEAGKVSSLECEMLGPPSSQATLP